MKRLNDIGSITGGTALGFLTDDVIISLSPAPLI